MALYQWTGGAGPDFGTPANWQVAGSAAASSPGIVDTATVAAAAATLTGNGSVTSLALQGTVTILGELNANTGSLGTTIDGYTTLQPGAVLETVLLEIGSSAGSAGTLEVGPNSQMVIGGTHPVTAGGTYAVALGGAAGSSGTLLVSGAGALVSGGNVPLAVGLNGDGFLRISDGGIVTAGPLDAGIGFACVIGNHVGATGTLEIEQASFLTFGAVFVGRSVPGTLDIGPGGLLAAGNMILGNRATGDGVVMVHGGAARLIISQTLAVGGPGIGTGTLSIGQGGLVSAGLSLSVDGPVILDQGSLVASSISIAANGALSGAGGVVATAGLINLGAIEAVHLLTVTGPIANTGALGTTAGSELVLVGSLSGTGIIALAKGSTVSLDATAAGHTVVFAGTGATLALRSPNAFGATIQGFGKGDKIEIDAVATGLAIAAGVLTLTGPAGPVAQMLLTGAYAPLNFSLAAGPGGRSIVQFSTIDSVQLVHQ